MDVANGGVVWNDHRPAFLTYTDVGNAGVVWNDHRPAFLTDMDVGNAGVAGAFTCHHPWRSQAGI